MKNKYLQIRFLKAALRLEERTGCMVFVDRSPHVDGIRAAIHVNGWESGGSYDFEITGYFDNREQLLRALHKLENSAPRVLEVRIQKLEEERGKLAEEDAEKLARRVAL